MGHPVLYCAIYLGTVQGKFQKTGSIGKIDHFLNERLPPITFNIKFQKFKNSKKEELLERFDREKKFFTYKHKNSSVINIACGFWRNKRYLSYQDDTPSKKNIKLIASKGFNKPLNVLWVYGDSLGVRFLSSMQQHKLCRNIFKKCRGTYTWNYKHYSQNYVIDKTLYTGADFNESKFLNDIKHDILQTELMTPKSVFLINFGLHVTMALQLERCFKLFESFLKMVHGLHEQYGYEKLPLVIWKSTTLPVFENSPFQNVTHTRFLSKQVT